MTVLQEFRKLAFTLKTTASVLAAMSVLMAALPAQAQTYQVLHSFTGGAVGYYPGNGVVVDRAGNLYGTAAYGGNYTPSCNYFGYQTGCGLVFKMSHHGSGWIFNILASFDGANGYNPEQLMTIAPDGSIYSSTLWGGTGDCHYLGSGCGTVFHLQPPATFCASVTCPWTISNVHEFLGEPSDGSNPIVGSLTMDAAGNLYGTTEDGGLYSQGTVYELSPTAHGWTMSVLHNFAGYDGGNLQGGVVLDNAGNLYGVTLGGGPENYGVVYQLTPGQSGWTEHILYSFPNYQTDGAYPSGNPVIDSSGNIYGSTESYGLNGGGTVWELSPGNGGWNFSVLYALTGGSEGGPFGGLLLDRGGNLYGTNINNGAHGYGSVFKLSPAAGGWSYTDLYDFTGGSDGGLPYSRVSMDSAGNLFGVTEVGGSSSQECVSGCGVVWEITP